MKAFLKGVWRLHSETFKDTAKSIVGGACVIGVLIGMFLGVSLVGFFWVTGFADLVVTQMFADRPPQDLLYYLLAMCWIYATGIFCYLSLLMLLTNHQRKALDQAIRGFAGNLAHFFKRSSAAGRG